jgi:methionyl-tRNA formyltransferase
MNNELRIIFFGTSSFVIPVLPILEQNFDLVAVVSNPDQKVGRKQILTPSPVKKWALDHKIPVITPEKLAQSIFTINHKPLTADLFVVASYGKIIPQEILDIPKFGAINIHPSLLPRYRGASPIQSAILNGDETSGISIIKMDAKMDHGPVIYVEEFGLSNLDNFETLSINMFARSAEILPIIIPQFVKKLIPAKPQNDSNATYTKIIKKEGGFFDIDNLPSPEKLDRIIRAYFPWPTAWTRWNNKIVKFLPYLSHPKLVSGSKEIPKLDQHDNYLIQMEGKKPVTMSEFLRGYPSFPLKKIE